MEQIKEDSLVASNGSIYEHGNYVFCRFLCLSETLKKQVKEGSWWITRAHGIFLKHIFSSWPYCSVLYVYVGPRRGRVTDVSTISLS